MPKWTNKQPLEPKLLQTNKKHMKTWKHKREEERERRRSIWGIKMMMMIDEEGLAYIGFCFTVLSVVLLLEYEVCFFVRDFVFACFFFHFWIPTLSLWSPFLFYGFFMLWISVLWSVWLKFWFLWMLVLLHCLFLPLTHFCISLLVPLFPSLTSS